MNKTGFTGSRPVAPLRQRSTGQGLSRTPSMGPPRRANSIRTGHTASLAQRYPTSAPSAEPNFRRNSGYLLPVGRDQSPRPLNPPPVGPARFSSQTRERPHHVMDSRSANYNISNTAEDFRTPPRLPPKRSMSFTATRPESNWPPTPSLSGFTPAPLQVSKSRPPLPPPPIPTTNTKTAKYQPDFVDSEKRPPAPPYPDQGSYRFDTGRRSSMTEAAPRPLGHQHSDARFYPAPPRENRSFHPIDSRPPMGAYRQDTMHAGERYSTERYSGEMPPMPSRMQRRDTINATNFSHASHERSIPLRKKTAADRLYTERDNVKFATIEQGRLPTIYCKNEEGEGRLRQDHPSGPKVAKIKDTSHAFFATKEDQRDFHKAFKAGMSREKFRELREAYGGVSRPIPGYHHAEASFEPRAFGFLGEKAISTHKSGGTVASPELTDHLANNLPNIYQALRDDGY